MESVKTNILYNLYDIFLDVNSKFRDRVCEECNFSFPTFYRKMRAKSRICNGVVTSYLSKAEKDKIHEIAKEMSHQLVETIDRIVS
mgnify:CR=1 FL=1